MLASVLAALLLGPGAQAPAGEVVAAVRMQGNLLTPDDEMRKLAGIEIGMPVGDGTLAEIETRLRAAGRFRRVEVLKRFASIDDPTQIVLVVVVDEGPVRIEGGDRNTPPRVVRRRDGGLMFLPILGFEDGYGFTYGVRVTRPSPLGPGSRLSFPLTWGGSKRAAVELDRNFADGPIIHRIEAGGSISQREHPFFREKDDRRQVWVNARRDLTDSLRVSGTAGWQHVVFFDQETIDESFPHGGADVVLDTRLDPMLPRNAVYGRAAWAVSNVPDGAVHQTTLDGRVYAGVPGGGVLVVRALRENARSPAPPYLKSILGGMPNLRGFRRGVSIGDTLVAGSLELRLPLSTPLSVGRFGVSAFLDVGQAYEKEQTFEPARMERAVGVGAWLSVAFVRLNLAVAHGIGHSTRVHFNTGVSP